MEKGWWEGKIETVKAFAALRESTEGKKAGEEQDLVLVPVLSCPVLSCPKMPTPPDVAVRWWWQAAPCVQPAPVLFYMEPIE